jgi:hypothetical protein
MADDDRKRPEWQGERASQEEAESAGETVRRPAVDVSRPPPRLPAAGEPPPRSTAPPAGPQGAPSSAASPALKLAALAIVAFLGYKLLAGGGHAKTDEPTREFQEQRAAHAGQPMVMLGPQDLARDFTQKAQEAVSAGQPIPGLAGASPELLRGVRQGEVQFYQIRIYDDHDEDGDVVTVTLDGGVQFGPLKLTNAGETLTIPVVGGTPPQITLRAVTDGYPPNGVTCGVHSSRGEWYSTILQPGQTQPVPFTAG